MKFSAEIDIKASAEKVWGILIDGAAYPEWDPYMIRLEGTVAHGEKIVAHTKLSDRAFPVTVSEFVPNQRMVWSSAMPLGLFSGLRTFRLNSTGDGVHFALDEEFKGLLLPLFKGGIPDMNPIFAEFCAALKKRAESA